MPDLDYETLEKEPKQKDPKAEAEAMALEIVNLGKKVEEEQAALMQNEAFKNFIELQKTFQERSAMVWAAIEANMINNEIKSIKGAWGSLTIAERLGWDIDLDELPSKFIKKVADTKKISDTFKLEGKPIKGASPKYSKYLMKRFKKEDK